MDLSRADGVGRFDDLARIYAAYRPDYPSAALDYLIARARLGPTSVLVDVGSGTGISSRLVAARGVQVVGIEPGDAMRAEAESAAIHNGPPPVYQAGRAEATGLQDASADAVLAAQAFHWFEPEAALREFHRILRAGGCVFLMWNERDETDPFTAAYGGLLRHYGTDAAALESSRQSSGDVLLTHPLFRDAGRVVFPHAQILDEDGLLGRAFSASYAPRDPDRKAEFAAELVALFARHATDGRLAMRYQTSITAAEK